MQTKYNLVITDTSCLILLNKIDELYLLRKLFQSIVITEEIADEFGLQLPVWVEIRKVKNKLFQNSLEIDRGEASAITLSMETGNSLLILDDKKGRRTANKLNLNYTGSLGIILKAKREGIIPSVRSVLDKVQTTNFRYAEKVFKEILSLASELEDK